MTDRQQQDLSLASEASIAAEGGLVIHEYITKIYRLIHVGFEPTTMRTSFIIQPVTICISYDILTESVIKSDMYLILSHD